MSTRSSLTHVQMTIDTSHPERALRCNPQLHPQRSRDPHDRGEGGIAFLRQSLVEPLATDSDLTGQLTHVCRPGDVVQGGADQTAVTRVLLRACCQIEARVFPCTQVLRDIPFREFYRDL